MSNFFLFFNSPSVYWVFLGTSEIFSQISLEIEKGMALPSFLKKLGTKMEYKIQSLRSIPEFFQIFFTTFYLIKKSTELFGPSV